MCREDFCEERPDVVSSLFQNADRNITLDAFLGTRPGRKYGPGGNWERMVQAYLHRSLTQESDILRALQGLMNIMGARFDLHFLAGMPTKYLDSSLLWAVRRQQKRRIGFPSFSWVGWTGEAIWPALEGTSHPFIHHPVTDNEEWFMNDTYIEWHLSTDGNFPEIIKNGEKAAYSWVSSQLSKVEPLNGSENLTIDLMGRPLQYQWKVSETARKNNTENRASNPRQTLPEPPPDLLEQSSQQRQNWESRVGTTLCFSAVIVKVLIAEENKLPNTNHFRYLSLKCLSGTTHGFVVVPDEYQMTNEDYLIVLSNVSRGSTLPFSDREVDGSLDALKAAKLAYNVMLVEWSGEIAIRIGIGILARGCMECQLLLGPTWKYITLA
jgi:hypothetical protein